MRVVTSAVMRAIEEEAAHQWRLSSCLLMENAAMGVVRHILRLLETEPHLRKCVVVVCGPGNNGGDGFAVARLLHARKVETNIITVGEMASGKNDAQANRDIARSMGVPIMPYPSGENTVRAVETWLQNAGVVVDALFGIGLKHAPEGAFAEIIGLMNACGKRIVAVDVPSGVDADTGRIYGTAVRAHLTVTFGFLKPGLLLYPGAEAAGQLHVENISLPEDAFPGENPRITAFTDGDVTGLMPKRPLNSHKGSFGRVRVLAGSRDMPGAAVLCGAAAYRAGAGLVEVCSVYETIQAVQRHIPEAITKLLPGKTGCLSVESYAVWKDREKNSSSESGRVVTLLGPGLGRGAGEFVQAVLRDAQGPVVLDADGLNAVAEDLSILRQTNAECVITPHPGEMSRLTKRAVGEITENPMEVASAFAREYGVIVLLKGARIVIAWPSGELFINTTGSPALAKAGSGDALAGIIAGLSAQGVPLGDAAVLGAYLHGRAGEVAGEKLSDYGVNARDVIDALPGVMRGL